MRLAASLVLLVGLFACLAACRGNVAIGGLSSQDAGPGSGQDSAAPGSAESSTSEDPCVDIEARSLQIREQSCAQCHGQNGPPTTIWHYVLDDNALVSIAAPGLPTPLIIPGDPASSYFFQRVELGLAGGQFGMPPSLPLASGIVAASTAATIVYPTSADLSILDAWIRNCVPGTDGGAYSSSTYGGNHGPEAGADGNTGGDAPSSGGGSPLDASSSVADGALADGALADRGPVGPGDVHADVDAPAAPPGLAGFSLVLEGVPQTPMTCPSDNWEFWPLDSGGQPTICDPSSWLCSSSAVLINVGQTPLAYTARATWSVPYPPGVPTGEPDVLTGVLDPQAQVDFSSVFVGGLTAIVGSSAPFSSPDAGHYAGDEGTIPWPAGVAGSGGATQMNVAQIDIRPSCAPVSTFW